MNQNKKLKNLARLIQNELTDAGFIVQRYDSYTTNSIYLKIDYGVGSSIRISDHKGKEHLHFKYNIGSFIEEEYSELEDGILQYYFPKDYVSELVYQAISDRQDKFNKYGRDKYEHYMSENRKNNASKQGFWNSSRIIIPKPSTKRRRTYA